MGLIACTSCGQSMSTQAKGCPHCGHPLRTERQIDPVNVWLLIALIAEGLLRFVLIKSGDGSLDLGEAIGFVLGSILFAGLIYLVVRLIRGRVRAPRSNRFILVTALVLAMLSLMQQVTTVASHEHTSQPAVVGR